MCSCFLAFLSCYLSLIGGAERNGGSILFIVLVAGRGAGIITGWGASRGAGIIAGRGAGRGAGIIAGRAAGWAAGRGAGRGAGRDTGVVGGFMLCINF